MRGKTARILVVDDDAAITLMVREILEHEGHDVTVAHTTQEGARLFTREPFELVIQDVNLPGGVSGYGACQNYKSIRETVAVIMITGEFTSNRDEAVARQLGADGFLRKPFSREELLREVDRGVKGLAKWREERPVFACRACGARFVVQDATRQVETVSVYCPNCTQVAQVTARDLIWQAPAGRAGSQRADARRILVVDDDELFRQFLGDLLVEAGYVVAGAKNGREGLQVCTQWRPQLVVADLLLPEMDGLTMCRHIREHPETGHVPILVITAFQSDASREEARKLGATYLTKPIEPEGFVKAVVSILSP
ncbi:MAG: response regulator [candidate division NC10 bacterium]|nr:response regulator [candidate division NC10 bacterium]